LLLLPGRVGVDYDGTESALSLDIDLPPELDYNLGTLISVLRKNPSASITFYGGEPLLRPDLITKIMTYAGWVKYLLHTNGTLLDRLSPAILNRFDTISVSPDGPERLTDNYRGGGVYQRVVRNVQQLRKGGFTGELIARMTGSEETCIEDAVRFLSSNQDLSFFSVHWELDADFSAEEN
jgi:uncharacterized protein